MSLRLNGTTAGELARVAGAPLPAETAERVAKAIGPALAVFAEVEGSLPFTAETSAFAVVQRAGAAQ